MTLEDFLTAAETGPTERTVVVGEANLPAAVELIAEFWDAGIGRDNLNMAVHGALLRQDVPEDVSQALTDAVRDACNDRLEYRKPASKVATDIAAGKRVPGMPRLIKYIGAAKAQELVQLMGVRGASEPAADPLPVEFLPLPEEWLTSAPPPLTYTVKALLPQGTVALLVAEGGAGKTTFALRLALAVATGRPLFGMEVTQGRVAYLAMEDQLPSLRRRIHHILSREQERMRREGQAPEALDRYNAALRENFFLVAGAGLQIHLVVMAAGQVTQGAAVSALIAKLPQPLELLVLDPMARLNGAEENNNAVGTALINAGERVARECGCTVLIAHHTGKAAAKEKDATQYSARGASAFVDAARSCVRLLAFDAKRAANECANLPLDLVERGDLIEVLHTKCNDGPKARPFLLRRQELDFELFVPERALGSQRQSQLMSGLFAWYCQHDRRPFSQNHATDAETLAEMFGGPGRCSRNKMRHAIDQARAAGDILPSELTAPNSRVPLLRFRPGFTEEM